MATKIRRSLFIGLGGTGMTALLHTKKLFIETYGEVPPMVAFLGIDTDGGYYDKSLKSAIHGNITLQPSEQLPIKVETDPQDIYRIGREHFSWLPEINLQYLKSMTLGAGAVRSNGRFAFTYNENAVKNKLNNIATQVLLAHHTTPGSKYESMGKDMEIHLIFSVCGGTGSGTFLNTAYLIKELYPNCKLCGYAVLPDVFRAKLTGAKVEKVKANAYGAIKDLDYLMHLNMGNNPISIDYLNRTHQTNKNPFNAVYLIDNKNVDSDVYDQVDDLAEMIGLSLMVATGELSIATKSVSDNVEKVIADGAMDIENKKAWVAGLGMCEICFDGDGLKDIYANKAVQQLITTMTNSCVNANALANNWIDEVQIRENNKQDQLIDYLATKHAPIPFQAINNPTDAQVDCDIYLNSLALPKASDTEEKLSTKKTMVLSSLHDLIKYHINTECGVATAGNIILSIQAQINICLNEMRAELKMLEDEAPVIDSALKSAIADLTKCMGTFFKSGRKDYESAVIDALNSLTTNKREILRRNGAITFYNWLQGELLKVNDNITKIKNILDDVYRTCEREITTIQNHISANASTFRINLAEEYATNISCNSKEIVFSNFTNKLIETNKIYDFAQKDSSEVRRILLSYTSTLQKASEYSAMTVNNVLGKMKDENPKGLECIIKTAIQKSHPLLQYDYRGYVPVCPPEEGFYIGVEDKELSVLVKNDYLRNLVQGARDIDFSSIGVKDRIIIFRQIGNMPAFAIKPLPECETEYNLKSNKCNFHWGADFERRMNREEFNLMPRAAVDDSLELWVKGFLFGLIKNENGMYYFKSEETGDILDDNWVELKQYRDEAFKEFKSYRSSVRIEFNSFFDTFQRENGTDAMQKIVDKAKLNYYEDFSQINLSKNELKTKGYEAIQDLIKNEMKYVKGL